MEDGGLRKKDGGFTSGPEDGVPSSDGVVGFGLPAQQQAGRIWPCISSGGRMEDGGMKMKEGGVKMEE